MLRILTSYRFALLLLLLLLVSVLIRAAGQAAADSAFVAAWDGILLCLLAFAIAASASRRALQELRRRRLRETTLSRQANPFVVSTLLPGTFVRATARRVLDGGGWAVRQVPDGRFILREKGSLGVWGSILFHFSMVLWIAGIGLSAGCGFRGMFALTEGDTFDSGTDAFKNVSAGPLGFGPPDTRVRITLEEFDGRYRVGSALTPASRVTVSESGHAAGGVVRVNNSLAIAGYQLHQGPKWGYSVGLVITDSTGSTLFSGLVRIASEWSMGRAEHRDRVRIGDGTEVRIAFVPEAPPRGIDGPPAGNGPQGSRMSLMLYRQDRVVAATALRLGEATTAGGYAFVFPEVRHWAQFELVRDPGVALMYIAFAAAALGLCLRLVCTRRTLGVKVVSQDGETTVFLWGTSEKFRRTFAEDLAQLGSRLRAELRSEEENVRARRYREARETEQLPCR